MFNADQLGYMASLSKMDPKDKCWCGWYSVGKCYDCNRSTELIGLNSADRIVQSCTDCGDSPRKPGLDLIHRRQCPQRKDGK